MTGDLNKRRPLPPSPSLMPSLANMLLVFLSLLVSSCHAGVKTEETVQVEVQDVRFDRISNSPVVILQDLEKKRAMPIWVGTFEAQAIALELQGTPPPRPLTHDLMKSILEQVGVELQRVVVSELKGSTFYAHIDLVTGGKTLEIDSRPSDAIALALRFHKPIFVAKDLFETALPSAPSGGRPEPASAKISGVTVQNLTAELAAYFNLPEPKGVLVADVGTEEGDESLQRGDVIVALAGEAVNNVGDFRDKLNNGKGQTVILGVLRGGEEIQVRLAPTEE